MNRALPTTFACLFVLFHSAPVLSWQVAYEPVQDCCESYDGRDSYLLDSSWNFGGWIAAGSTTNADGNRTSSGNAPLGFNNFADGYVLNQGWAFAERVADNGGSGTAWGFRADAMFGVDGPDNQAFGDGGWDADWDTGGEYGVAIPQLYTEFAWNRFKTRVGRFYTIIGYEVTQAPDNFFYSHPYTFIYNEPFTHTGVLSEYEAHEKITLYGGWTMGWDSGFENLNGGSSFLGGMSLEVSDSLELRFTTIVGDPGDLDGQSSDSYMHTAIVDLQVTDQLNFIVQHDFQSRTSGNGPESNAWGINQYLLYTLNEYWQVGGRMEIFRDDDGVRVGNGYGNYNAFTSGLVYRPTQKLMLRNEARWDWFDGPGRPFDNNNERGFFTYGTSIVYTF